MSDLILQDDDCRGASDSVIEVNRAMLTAQQSVELRTQIIAFPGLRPYEVR